MSKKLLLNKVCSNINDIYFLYRFLQENPDYSIVFSDGSFSKNGIGTFSYIILSKDFSCSFTSSSKLYSSSRISEFMGAISALEKVQTKNVFLFVDYFEIKEVLLEKKSSNSIYLNPKIENIKKVISEFDCFNITTIKGHSGVILNEIVDCLCNGKSHQLYFRLQLLFRFESKNEQY